MRGQGELVLDYKSWNISCKSGNSFGSACLRTNENFMSHREVFQKLLEGSHTNKLSNNILGNTPDLPKNWKNKKKQRTENWHSPMGSQNKHFCFVPQHLCYGSSFLPSLSVSWSHCWKRPFPTPSGHQGTVVVVIIIVVLYRSYRYISYVILQIKYYIT